MIRKFLDLSTAHLDMPAKNWLDQNAGEPDLSVAMMPYGWFGYAQETKVQLDAIPECLSKIMIFARTKGCEYILLDHDGVVLQGLAVYDDEGNEINVDPIARDTVEDIGILRQPCTERGISPDELHPDLLKHYWDLGLIPTQPATLQVISLGASSVAAAE